MIIIDMNQISLGDSKLAETKNMYISEILLANKIAEDFMSCSDQNSSIKYIRNSKHLVTTL